MSEREGKVSPHEYYFMLMGKVPIPTDGIDFSMFARAVTYAVRRGKYHRRSLCRALIVLTAYAPEYYRDVAWKLIQEVPLSHLLYIPDEISKPSKENKRRLRHAIAVRIAKSSREEILRAFFMNPERFRRLFSYLKLPRRLINGKEIRNENYLLAVRLSEMSAKDAMKELDLSPQYLVGKLKIPMHVVMSFIEDVETARELAKLAGPDDFFRHARWFREVLGDEEFRRIALEKVEGLSDPLSFLAIQDHLLKTGALDESLVRKIDEKAERMTKSLLSEANIESLAILLDVSGSMTAAVEITKKLVVALEKFAIKAPYIIAFEGTAFRVSKDELAGIGPGGSTSIGAAFVLLKKLVDREGKVPDAVLLISDLCENTPPMLKDALKLYRDAGWEPLIVVLHVGSRCNLDIDCPHAVIPLEDFHPRLLATILKEIVTLQKEATRSEELRVIKRAAPLEEAIASVSLPVREEETKKPGYLEKLLAGETG